MTGGAGPAARVDIVIVNWNAGPLLAQCLDSIAAHAEGHACRVVVVDNASTDGSETTAAQARPGIDVHLVRNGANRGFAAACNQGAGLGTAPYLLFLNPDARLLPGTLAGVLDRMGEAAQAGVGIAGVRLVAPSGETQRCCARLPNAARLVLEPTGLGRLLPAAVLPPHFMVEWDHLEDRDVPQVMGAFLLVRRPLFESLGGFDERFFVYYEDVDICARAWVAGWRCRHFAGPVAVHEGQGTTRRVVAMRTVLSGQSRVAYAAKHAGPGVALLALLAVALAEPVSRTLLALARRSPADLTAAWKAAALLWIRLPALVAVALRGRG